ncbi:hypothetical protein [Pseudomonas alkylphenolica]|nr:hypothetical protein [Pseudomonas alkylphenolica]
MINSLGTLLERIKRRTSEHLSPLFILNGNGKKRVYRRIGAIAKPSK